MKSINVLNKYDILIKRGIINNCGDQIKKISKANIAAIVTDDNVAKHYIDAVSASLEGAGFKVFSFVFPHGEENKTIETVMQMVEFFAKCGLTRSDIAIALGG